MPARNPPQELKTDRLEMRIAPSEKAFLREVAEALGLGITQFVRSAALEKAKIVKKTLGEEPAPAPARNPPCEQSDGGGPLHE